MSVHRREHTRLSKWLHRRGYAREINSVHSGGVGWTSAYVETALPLEWLARYASRSWDSRIVEIERMGILRRRWHIKFRTRRWP